MALVEGAARRSRPRRAKGKALASVLSLATAERRAIFWQMMRFVLTGGAATVCYAIVYWPIARFAPGWWPLGDRSAWPLIASFAGYVAGVVSGYVLHSSFSFRGHGRRDNLARTGGRFFVVSLVSLAMNSFFVWLCTGPLHGAEWWPLIPIIFVTPLVTFSLNRLWVFA